MLAHWARITGGYATFWHLAPRSPERQRVLDSLVQRMYYDFQNYYELIIEFPLPADKPRDWKLEVLDERGKKMGKLSLFYPQIAPCAGTAAERAERR